MDDSSSPQQPQEAETDTAKQKNTFSCETCDRTFTTKGGRTNHQRKCSERFSEGNRSTSENSGATDKEEESEIERLPAEPPSTEISPCEQFMKDVSEIYEHVVFWKKNIFLVPSGKQGKSFIEEINKFLNEWLQNSVFKPVAFKAVMILPHLILQKPSKHSKTKDHVRAMERRMKHWKDWNLKALLEESQTIQNHLTKSMNKISILEISKKFAHEMERGNINKAIKLLSENTFNGVLPLTDETLVKLKMKHPEEKSADSEVLLNDTPTKVHPIRFDEINEELVKKATLKTMGGAGPSGLDGEGWCRILTSKSFGTASVDLRKTIAEITKRLCCEKEDNLEALLACKLIPLDKNPGLRPIGVGEILRRIVGKTVMMCLKKDVSKSVGSLQTSAGQEAGIEATFHAMREIFNEKSTEGIILVDASNAFNAVNRSAFLHNINIICPSLATFTQNCYSTKARLFVVGGHEVASREGTTQGDPIAMAVYAIATIPMILTMVESNTNASPTKIAAYADDLSSAGKIAKLKISWDQLCTIGPKYGYFPESRKSWLIVKPEQEARARKIFEDTSINITTDGRRYLGGAIGSNTYKETYADDKISELTNQLTMLSEIAKHQPQAAYSAFIFGFKHKVTYLMRILPSIDPQLQKLDTVMNERFIPAITNGVNCSETERYLLSLPPKFGGLGLTIFSETSTDEHDNSLKITEALKRDILNQKSAHEVDEKLNEKKLAIKKRRTAHHTNLLSELRMKMSSQQTRLNDLAIEKHASLWLTTLPIKDEGYTLTKQQFWDLVRLRYGWQLKRLPSHCECGASFSPEHALSCKKGGFVSMRHNHLRNITAKLLGECCKDVRIEPTLQPLTGEALSRGNISDEARLDVSARGFWESHQLAFFDIRVFNPMAKRYVNQTLKKSYEWNEKEKKRGYNERVMQLEHGTFSPLVFAATGGLGRECEKVYNRIGSIIAEKRDAPYNTIVTWVRRKVGFATINSITTCLRGSRCINNQLTSSIENDAVVSESVAT